MRLSSLSYSTASSSPNQLAAPKPSKNFQSDWKRFQPQAPTLLIDAEGHLLEITDTARRLLEYGPGDEVDSYFFSHIHGKNLHQVMRDLALMVKRGKEHASWMLRLRTGQGRWRWYKAEALNKLHTSTAAVIVRLRNLYKW